MGFSVSQLPWIMLPAILAGFVQSVTGFGSGIILMMFFPVIFSVLQSSSLNQSMCLFLNILLFYRYRISMNLKLTLLPLVFYFPVYFEVLTMAVRIRADFLKPILGIFVLGMAIYFIVFSGKFIIRAGVLSASVCAALSAIIDAFFGMGGPPMAVYFLTTSKSKEEYLGAIQTYFMICSLYGVAVRIQKGQITASMVSLIACGVFALMVGVLLGGKVVGRIDAQMMKKLVYGFIGVAGIITFVTSLTALLAVL
jgi:uncharacterized membrane protein YfcA